MTHHVEHKRFRPEKKQTHMPSKKNMGANKSWMNSILSDLDKPKESTENEHDAKPEESSGTTESSE